MKFLLLSLVALGAAHATNIGFENGNLDDWTTTGEADAGLVASTWSSWTAPYGTYFGLLGAGCSTNTLFTSFEGVQGTSIAGKVAWDGDDYLPYNDEGKLEIIKDSNDHLLFYTNIAQNGDYNNVDWTSWDYTLPATGSYTLKVSSTNVGDCSFDSYMLLDTCMAPEVHPEGPYLLNLGVSSSVTLLGTTTSTETSAWTTDCEGTISSDGVFTANADASPRVCSLTLTASDKCGTSSGTAILVIADPSAGFVTGGGWIISPENSYTADPTVSGKATFGFVSKYKKGQSSPSGETQFQFSAVDFTFHSTSYEWLVITGNDCAKYKGDGTVNDSGSYGFMLTACDSSAGDTFRIKIWEKSTSATVYDNQMGSDDNSYDATVISGGSIQIHQNKKLRHA